MSKRRRGKSTPENIASVTPMPSVQPFTLGEALEVLEKRIRNAGVSVDISPPRGYDAEAKNEEGSNAFFSNKAFKYQFLIGQAIAQSITFGVCKPGNIGKEGSEKSLVAGNVVALKFVALHGGGICNCVEMKAGYVSGRSPLDISSTSARFLVVAAGPKQVAFYSPSEIRFLQVNEEGCFLPGSVAVDVDRPRAVETFEVQLKKKGIIKLCNLLYGRFATVQGFGDSFTVFQISGLDF